MSTTFTHKRNFESGGATTQLSTGLNSLSNNSLALSTAYTVPDGVEEVEVEVSIASFGGNVTAGGAILLWALATLDGGTTYEDGGASAVPQRAPDLVLPLRSGISSAQVLAGVLPVPPAFTKFLLQNAASGQTMASSGNTLKTRVIEYTSYAP